LAATTLSPSPLKVTVGLNPNDTLVGNVTAYALSTDATGKAFTISIATNGAITLNEGASGVLGQTTIASDPAIGATTLTLADGGGIPNVANSYVLISETISSVVMYQYAKITSVATNTLVLAEALKYDFTTSAVVQPCFQRIASPTAGTGTVAATGNFALAPLADRTIAY
jgi:hypothetical protein